MSLRPLPSAASTSVSALSVSSIMDESELSKSESSLSMMRGFTTKSEEIALGSESTWAYAFAEANGYKMTSDLYDPAAGEGLCGTKMPWQDRDEFCRVEPGSWPAILAPILLFIGGWWYELRLLWRYFRPQLVLGGAVLTAYQQKWRTENTVVPANTTFMIHRYRESTPS